MYDSFSKKVNSYNGRYILMIKSIIKQSLTFQGHYYKKEFTIHLMKRRRVIMVELFR